MATNNGQLLVRYRSMLSAQTRIHCPEFVHSTAACTRYSSWAGRILCSFSFSP